jgi:ankyrin repeat protein
MLHGQPHDAARQITHAVDTARRQNSESLISPQTKTLIASLQTNYGHNSSHPFDINSVIFSNNRSLLHVTAQYGSVDDMQFLLNRGIKPTLTDSFGKQALHYIINQIDAIAKAQRLFETRQVNINLSDHDNRTVLHDSVSEQCNYDYVKFLLISGANPNCQDTHQQTPLHIAIANSDILAVRILTQHRETLIDIPDALGNTPLFYAQHTTNPEKMNNMLLHYHANPNYKNYAGDTPLSVAVAAGNEAATLSLLAHGARPQDAKLNVSFPSLSHYTLRKVKNENIINQLSKRSYPAYWLKHAAIAGVVTFIYAAVVIGVVTIALQYALLATLITGIASRYIHNKKYQRYQHMADQARARANEQRLSTEEDFRKPPSPNTVQAHRDTREALLLGSSYQASSKPELGTWFNRRAYSNYNAFAAGQVASTVGDVTFLACEGAINDPAASAPLGLNSCEDNCSADLLNPDILKPVNEDEVPFEGQALQK